MTVVGKMGDPNKPVFIMDLGAPNPYANFITEVAEDGDLVRVGFAALSVDGDGQRKATVVVRLHIKKDVAWEMCRELRKIEDAKAHRRKK